jgi:hypothetical protein
MAHTDADHDLLMSILAWRRGLITRDALAGGCRVWIGDGPETRPLGDVLEARGVLTPSARAQAQAMATKHLAGKGAGLAAFETSVAELSQAVGVDLARLSRRLQADRHQKGKGRSAGSGAGSRSGSKTQRRSAPVPTAPFPVARVALGLILAVMSFAVLALARENRRLETEVGRLSRDNKQWQWSFRDKVEAVAVREVAVRDGLIALEKENQGRREAEEARDRTRIELARVERERRDLESRRAALTADLERSRTELTATRAALAGVIAAGPDADDRRAAYEAALPALRAHRESLAAEASSPGRRAALVAVGRAALAAERGEESLAAFREAMAVARALGATVDPGDLLAGDAPDTTADNPDRLAVLNHLRDQGFPADPFAHDEVMLGQVDQPRR